MSVLDSPAYCQYASGKCDQNIMDGKKGRILFLYPSDPPQLTKVVEATAAKLAFLPLTVVVTWKELDISGKVIFCEICKAMRLCEVIVCDVTHMNFNLMFEVGYALGLNKSVILIRDTSYLTDKVEFEKLGLFDNLGYYDFKNSDDLYSGVKSRLSTTPMQKPIVQLNRSSPLYVVKGLFQTEGEMKTMTVLKKSPLRFRTFDPSEHARISLYEARKEISSSMGMIAHLLDPAREGATVHNARCALLAGIAVAEGKQVTLLQEGAAKQPIDYRDIVKTYESTEKIERLLENIIRGVNEDLLYKNVDEYKRPPNFLEEIDLGDIAAENEIRPLRKYFLPTSQFQDAKRGYATILVGRKGAGKTAIFYQLRDSYKSHASHLVIDLKPEGYQLEKLKGLFSVDPLLGEREHNYVAFWVVLLLKEIARKIVLDEKGWASRDDRRQKKYEAIVECLGDDDFGDDADFSERLLSSVDKLEKSRAALGSNANAENVTQTLFSGEIRKLQKLLSDILKEKDGVRLLIDNLDKAWPVRGATSKDLTMLRSLLTAAGKLKREFEKLDVEFGVLLFLRNDIYDLLLRSTLDKGKDTPILLDWNDPEAFKEIFRRRITTNTNLTGTFDDIWNLIFAGNVGAQGSFGYILERTLMRPRDFLIFLRKAIEVAINRGHSKVSSEDILAAEGDFSQDALLSLGFELDSVYSMHVNLVYIFTNTKATIATDQLKEMVVKFVKGNEELASEIIEALLWFGFLGVKDLTSHEERFAFQSMYDIERLTVPIDRGQGAFVIHPAFRKALDIA